MNVVDYIKMFGLCLKKKKSFAYDTSIFYFQACNAFVCTYFHKY